MAAFGFQQLPRVPLTFASYTDNYYSKGPGMVKGKLYRLLLVGLPHQAEVWEMGHFSRNGIHIQAQRCSFCFLYSPHGLLDVLTDKTHSSSSSSPALDRFPFNLDKDVSLRKIWNPQQILLESSSTQKISLSENMALSWILLRDSVIQKRGIIIFLKLQKSCFLCNRLTMRYETILENMLFCSQQYLRGCCMCETTAG